MSPDTGGSDWVAIFCKDTVTDSRNTIPDLTKKKVLSQNLISQLLL